MVVFLLSCVSLLPSFFLVSMLDIATATVAEAKNHNADQQQQQFLRHRQTQDAPSSDTSGSSTGNCVAGGAGYGLAMDGTRADILGLHWTDIPRNSISVEFWFKALDPHVNAMGFFPYSVYAHKTGNDTDGSSISEVYEVSNELVWHLEANFLELCRAEDSCTRLLSDIAPQIEQAFFDQEWHHYAFTWESKSEGSIAFYFDGYHLDFGTASLKVEENIEIDYTTTSFAAQWDTPDHDDAVPYFGQRTIDIITVTNPCSSDSYKTFSGNTTNFVVLLERAPSTPCSDYTQALLAAQNGAWAVIFHLPEENNDLNLQLQNTNETKLTIPVASIHYEDAQKLLRHGNITFFRTRNAEGSNQLGDGFRRPIQPGGVLSMGQEPDRPWGDFDPFQAVTGIYDEVRVWNTVRTPTQIQENYKRFIDTNTVDAKEHLHLYWNFDDLVPVVEDTTGDDVVVKVETADLSMRGTHPGLVGALPTVKNEMTYTNQPPRPPTRPNSIPASSSPLVGNGEIIIAIVPGSFTVLELKSYDPEGDDLITTIETLPPIGQLYPLVLDVDSTTSSQVGLRIGEVVVDTNRTENKRVSFLAPESFTVDATFQFSVSDGGDPVTATVRLVPHKILNPVSDTLTIAEDTVGFMSLARPSQITQKNMQVIITSLPERGKLFQAQFRSDTNQQYFDLATVLNEFGMMEPINETGTLVSNSRGIVMFAANKNEFSNPSNAIYTSFSYQFLDEDGGVMSEEGRKEIIVTAKNDAPVSIANNVSSVLDRVILTLNSSDVDAHHIDSFATRKFTRLTSFPKGGQLFQYAEAQEDKKGPIIDSSVTEVPQSFAWASNVVRFSSQYSACGPQCYSWNNPECQSNDALSGGWKNGTCTDTSWHASNILGSPNAYPEYGDRRLNWALSTTNFGNEWIELEFPYEMYINAIGIYETFKPGAVWKVSTTSEYLDDPNEHCSRSGVPGISECSQLTKWETLWSKPRDSLSLGHESATIFEPRLCPSLTKNKMIRIDVDTSRVFGWNEYDAVKITGTLDYPPGWVSDELNRVVYVPEDGIHGDDSFKFVSSDCILEGEEGEYSISIMAPVDRQFSQTVVDVIPMNIIAEPNEVITHELDLLVMLLQVEALLGVRLVNATATIWYTDALGLESGSKFENILPGNTSILLQVGTRNYGKPKSHIEFWLQDATVSSLIFRFKYAVSLFIECMNGQLDLESGTCLCKSARWTGIDCGIEVQENMNGVPSSIKAIVYSYFAILVFMCLVFSLIVIRNHKATIVKVSQPFFLYVLLGGCLFTSMAIPARVETTSDATCTITYWVFFMGFSVVFGSLLAKIWRTYQIFMSGMKMRRKVVTVKETSVIIAVLLCMNVFVLSLWTGLDHPQWQRTVLVEDSYGYALSTIGECTSSTNSPYIIACLAMNLGTMIIAVILCLRARKLPDKFSETYVVNFCTYITLNVYIIAVPVLILVRDDPSARLIVECSIVFLVVFAVLACIFSNLIGWLYFASDDEVRKELNAAVRAFGSSKSIAKRLDPLFKPDLKSLSSINEHETLDTKCSEISLSLRDVRNEDSSSLLNTSTLLVDDCEKSRTSRVDSSSEVPCISLDARSKDSGRLDCGRDVTSGPLVELEAAKVVDEPMPYHIDGHGDENDRVLSYAESRVRIWSVLQSLARVKPLLRQHPVLLTEADSSGITPLLFLRDQTQEVEAINNDVSASTRLSVQAVNDTNDDEVDRTMESTDPSEETENA